MRRLTIALIITILVAVLGVLLMPGVESQQTGSTIAFIGPSSSGGGPEVYLINKDGSGLTPLGVAAFSVGWSPDAQQLVFGDTDARLGVMQADGTHVRYLGVTGGAPRWSPDGSRIGFVNFDSGSGRLYLINPDGTGLTDLRLAATSFDWSPDGRQLVFSDRNNRLFIANADGSGARPLGWRGMAPRWSPDGQRIAFIAGEDSGRLYLVDPTGANLTDLGVSTSACSWSPDSTQLVIGSRSNNVEMFIINADGSGLRGLGVSGSSPDWQPMPAAFKVTGITPTQAPNTGPVDVTVTGSRFRAGATVRLTRNGQPDILGTDVQVVNETTLTARFDLMGAAIGRWSVVVISRSGQVSEPLVDGFSITGPPPSVNAISPSQAPNTRPARLQVTGANFQAGAVVQLTRPGQSPIPGTDVTQEGTTGITATFDLTNQPAGRWTVIVINPDEGSGSLPDGFTISPPPVIQSVSPDFAPNDLPLQLVINGANFQAGAAAKLRRSGQADILGSGVTVESSTRITANFDLTGAAAGKWDVVVINPDGGEGELKDGLTITGPLPRIEALDPRQAPNTVSVQVQMTGANFQAGASVKLRRAGQADIPGTDVTVVDASHLSATFDLRGRAVGEWDAVVINPDSGQGSRPAAFTVSAPPAIERVVPPDGANVGPVRVTLTGRAFQQGASAILSRAGQPDIPGTQVEVADPEGSGTIYRTLRATFDLTGQALGAWDVVVNNPDGGQGRRAQGFVIHEFTGADALRELAAKYARIETLQAHATVDLRLQDRPLGTYHFIDKSKAPDKTRQELYDSAARTTLVGTVIVNGVLSANLDPSGSGPVTNLAQEAGIAEQDYLRLDPLYNVEGFLELHEVELKETTQEEGRTVFVVEARPRISLNLYTALELRIDRERGVVLRTVMTKDGQTVQTTIQSDVQPIGDVWIATRSSQTTTTSSGELVHHTVLESIIVNAPIPDSEFALPGRQTRSAFWPEAPARSAPLEILPPSTRSRPQSTPTLSRSRGPVGDRLLDSWADPNAYQPEPILFLHGFAGGSPATWQSGESALMGDFSPYFGGWGFYLYRPGMNDPNGSVDTYDNGQPGWADKLQGFVGSTLGESGRRAQKVRLVAHSMGGLASREYITNPKYGGFSRVSKLITVGTPHLGSSLATVARTVSFLHATPTRIFSWLFPPLRKVVAGADLLDLLLEALGDINMDGEAVKDMVPGSAFLAALNGRDPHDTEVHYYLIVGEWYINGDGVVPLDSQAALGLIGNRKGTVTLSGRHFHGGSEVPASVAQGYLLRFLEQEPPDIQIVEPVPSGETYETDESEVTLEGLLQGAYLPATTQLIITARKDGTVFPLRAGMLFRPYRDWTPGDPDSPSAGFSETVTFTEEGDYLVTAEARSPYGQQNFPDSERFRDRDSITIRVRRPIDLLVSSIGADRAQVGFPKRYTIRYGNAGGQDAEDVVLTFTPPTGTSFISASGGGTFSGGQVRWTFPTLAAKQYNWQQVTVMVNPGAPQRLIAVAEISFPGKDFNPLNNRKMESQPVQRPRDPNEKLPRQEDRRFIPAGEPVQFVVYFENIGQSPALNVTVKDSLAPLDGLVDFSTLTVEPTSHPADPTLDPPRGFGYTFDPASKLLTVEFSNIILQPNPGAPQTKNPDAEGWFVLTLQPLPNLPSGTRFENEATISFFGAAEDLTTNRAVCILDTSPPSSQVEALPPIQSNPTFEVKWQGDDGEGSGVHSFDILFSQDGGPYQIWLDDTTETSAAFSGQAGHTYRFYSLATDGIGNQESPPAGADTETLVGTPTTVPAGLTMVSIPVAFGSRDTGLVDPLTVMAFEGQKWARWSPEQSRYVTYSEDLNQPDPSKRFTFLGPDTPGKGYWGRFSAPTEPQFQGARIRPNESVIVPLAAGWNMVGSPYFQALTWDLDQILVQMPGYPARPLRSASDLVSDYLWGWRQDPADPSKGAYQLVYDREVLPIGAYQMEPWHGYWIQARQACELVLPGPDPLGRRPTPRAANGWVLELSARAGDAVDGGNLLGVASGLQSRSGEHRLALASPPPPPGEAPAVDLFFPDAQGGRLAADLRAGSGTREEWELAVASEAVEGTIALTWQGLRQIPKDLALTLVDLTTGQRRYLRTTPNYVYQPARGERLRRFRLIAEQDREQSLRITGLQAVPTRGRAIEVRFTLSQAADTTVTVRRLNGREAGVLERGRTRSAGDNTLRWEARDAQGRPLLPGVYLLEVQAADQEGRQVRAVKTIRVR